MPYPEIKGVVFDLDKTAVAGYPEALPSQRLIDVVKEAKDELLIATASGRSTRLCREIWKKFEMDGLSVVSGGNRVVNTKTEEVVWESLLPEEHVPGIIEICQGYAIEKLFVSGNGDLLAQELVGPYRSNLIVADGLSFEHSEDMVAKLIS